MSIIYHQNITETVSCLNRCVKEYKLQDVGQPFITKLVSYCRRHRRGTQVVQLKNRIRRGKQ